MATGYYYYGARYYDPKRSFWLSVDPLADITLSPYAYVWNDPVNFADPTGLMGERVGGKNPKDWYRDRFGNVSWHDSQEDLIKGKNGEILTRLGKSGSYINAKGGVTTLNEDRTVTQGGETSLLISPEKMSASAILGDNDRKMSSPGVTPQSLSSFETKKNSVTFRGNGPEPGGGSLSYDIPIISVPYMLLDAGLAEGLMQAGMDGNTASNTAKGATMLYGFKAPKGVTGELGIAGKTNPRSINVDEIHFMQSSIKNTTGEFTVLGNAAALKSGTLNPDVLTLNVWRDINGKIWTLDHRRLAAFKLSGLKKAPVNFTSPTGQMWKMTTTNGGTSIKLKLGGGKSMIIK